MSDYYIKNIGLLQTPRGSVPASGKSQGETIRYRHAAVLVRSGAIEGIAENGLDVPGLTGEETVLDAGGRLVTPGLVDAHTHLVFGGWRQHELPLKLAGKGYLDILKMGGGILDTVRHTRAMDEDRLYARALRFAREMSALGVTACEMKSGYGLNLIDELKQLRVIRRLGKTAPMTVAATFLGAHALPEEYAGDREAYIDFLCDQVIPQVAGEGLAEFCDVFCEQGVFNAPQSEKILACGLAHGLRPKIHADEIEEIGGTELAGKVRAISAEHLIATKERGIGALREGGVIAVLLPQTSFYLGKPYARARDMISAGVPVAVASDFNPGSCPSLNLQLAINIACLNYRLQPEEILTAVTLNGACAINRGGRIGSIEQGKQADLVVWDASDFETVCYRFGSNLAHMVMQNGKIVSLRS